MCLYSPKLGFQLIYSHQWNVLFPRQLITPSKISHWISFYVFSVFHMTGILSILSSFLFYLLFVSGLRILLGWTKGVIVIMLCYVAIILLNSELRVSLPFCLSRYFISCVIYGEGRNMNCDIYLVVLSGGTCSFFMYCKFQ